MMTMEYESDAKPKPYPAEVVKAIKDGLLNREFHDRLLGDLPAVVSIAGVPDFAVWSRLSEYLPTEEYEWVRNMRGSSDNGLCFTGEFPIPVEDKMMAIAGACLRNYTDARVMPLQSVIAALKEGVMPVPTVLLIPNFCQEDNDGGNIASWDTAHLLSMLLARGAQRKKTIIGITSMAVLSKQYGLSFKNHVMSKFAIANSDHVTPAGDEE